MIKNLEIFQIINFNKKEVSIIDQEKRKFKISAEYFSNKKNKVHLKIGNKFVAMKNKNIHMDTISFDMVEYHSLNKIHLRIGENKSLFEKILKLGALNTIESMKKLDFETLSNLNDEELQEILDRILKKIKIQFKVRQSFTTINEIKEHFAPHLDSGFTCTTLGDGEYLCKGVFNKISDLKKIKTFII